MADNREYLFDYTDKNKDSLLFKLNSDGEMIVQIKGAEDRSWSAVILSPRAWVKLAETLWCAANKELTPVVRGPR
nr:hypothetical protein [uncultured Rhodopila sp.]